MQWSVRGHDEQFGSLGLHTVAPNSMRAWFVSPGLSASTTIASAPDHTADGKMMKEDIRGVYDGSIFYTIADRRAGKT